MNQLIQRLSALAAQHRTTTWMIHGALVALWVFGLLNTTTDFRFKSIVGSQDEALQHLIEYREHWEAEDANVLVLLQSEGSILNQKGLELVEEIRSQLKTHEFIGEVVSFSRWPIIDASAGSLDTMQLYELDELDSLSLTKRRELGLTPTVLNDKTTAAVFIGKLNSDTDNIRALLQPVADIRAGLESIETKWNGTNQSFGTIQLSSGGIPTLRADVAHEIKTNQLLFLLLTAIVTVLMLGLLFRTLPGVIFPLLLSLIALIFVYGVMGLVGEPINMVSQVYISLITVITVADAIHIISTYLRLRHPRLGLTAHQAIAKTYQEVGLACFVTSVTTGIGFVSLLSSNMAILRSFGVYATLGVLYAFILQITLLPTFLLFFKATPRAIGPIDKLSQMGAGLGDWILHHPGKIKLVFLFVVALFCFGTTQADLNNFLKDNLDSAHPTMQAHDVIDQELSGTLAYHFDFHLPKNDSGDALTFERMRALATLEEDLSKIGVVRTVMGPSQIIGRLFGSLKQTTFEVPKDTKAFAQTMLLLDDADADPFASMINEEAGRIRVIATISDIGANQSMGLVPELNALIQKVESHSDMQGQLTGVAYAIYKGFNRLAYEIIMSLVIATFLICLCVGFLFKRFSWALISLIPNTIPLLSISALSAFAGWSINPQTAVLFTIALGIAVDDTIHFFNRLHQEQQSGLHKDADAVIKATLEHLFAPMFITSLVLGLGFAVNIASSFSGARIFGALGATSIFVALIADMTILPVIMLWRERRRQKADLK